MREHYKRFLTAFAIIAFLFAETAFSFAETGGIKVTENDEK